jgi:hypothetical protein
MSRCRKKHSNNTEQLPLDEEITATSLTATSRSQYLWPLPIFHPSNVLSPSDYNWNSGTYAPASIVIDLGSPPVYITRIALLTEMLPAVGKVSHQIRIGTNSDTLHSVCWYNGVSFHGEWTQIQLIETGGLQRKSRFVEIITHKSPSWVAWRRIRVWKAVEQ